MEKNKIILFASFLVLWVSLLIFNLSRGSQWAIDATFSITILIIFFFLVKKFEIRTVSILLFNMALMLHNLGGFGAYQWRVGWFEWDLLVHSFSSLVAGFIIAEAISRRLHLRKGKLEKFTVVDEHKVLTIILVVSLVIMLGMVIELMEFIGYNYLGSGEGLFFFGYGDFGIGDYAKEYFDVMTDIIANIVGALLGVFAYYMKNL